MIQDVQLLECVGAGGFGVVYRGAYQGGEVAVKLAVVSSVDRTALREALVSPQLRHPHVVQTYVTRGVLLTSEALDQVYAAPTEAPPRRSLDLLPSLASEDGMGAPRLAQHERQGWREVLVRVGAAPGKCLVMLVQELCAVGNLSRAIRDGLFRARPGVWSERVGRRVLLRTAAEICRGMIHLHSVSVLHGDLKPANVLLARSRSDRRGFVAKVGDFGLAHMLADTSRVESSNWGTVTYASPESFNGTHWRSSDVYSFGMLLWEMMTGLRPYEKLTPVQILMGVSLQGLRPEWPEADWPELCALGRRCLEADPAARPSFRELEAALVEMEEALREQSMRVSREAERPGPLRPPPDGPGQDARHQVIPAELVASGAAEVPCTMSRLTVQGADSCASVGLGSVGMGSGGMGSGGMGSGAPSGADGSRNFRSTARSSGGGGSSAAAAAPSTPSARSDVHGGHRMATLRRAFGGGGGGGDSFGAGRRVGSSGGGDYSGSAGGGASAGLRAGGDSGGAGGQTESGGGGGGDGRAGGGSGRVGRGSFEAGGSSFGATGRGGGGSLGTGGGSFGTTGRAGGGSFGSMGRASGSGFGAGGRLDTTSSYGGASGHGAGGAGASCGGDMHGVAASGQANRSSRNAASSSAQACKQQSTDAQQNSCTDAPVTAAVSATWYAAATRCGGKDASHATAGGAAGAVLADNAVPAGGGSGAAGLEGRAGNAVGGASAACVPSHAANEARASAARADGMLVDAPGEGPGADACAPNRPAEDARGSAGARGSPVSAAAVSVAAGLGEGARAENASAAFLACYYASVGSGDIAGGAGDRCAATSLDGVEEDRSAFFGGGACAPPRLPPAAAVAAAGAAAWEPLAASSSGCARRET